MKGQPIGYIRVSTFEQNPDHQLDSIEVDKIFTDKASGKDTNRVLSQKLLTAKIECIPGKLRPLAH